MISFSVHPKGNHPTHQSGFTLVELLIAFALAAMLMVGLNGVIGQALTIQDAVSEKNELTRQARFAMAQMTRVVSQSRLLLVPMNDRPSTPMLENIREQTEPPSAPPTGSTLGTAVLSVTLPDYFDLDGNAIPDADNDGDGRIDEDIGYDNNADELPGIGHIDDDGDGQVDESNKEDDDEDEDTAGTKDEDQLNGLDDDGDGNIDEDIGADMNGDLQPGIAGEDDDGDSFTDEGSVEDDDEDGVVDEDWYDPVVFYLSNGTLMQRTPVPWDEDNSGTVSGKDFIIEPIAENVSRFRVERVSQGSSRSQIINITLELTDADTNTSVSLNSRVRVGAAL